jgi:itaconyl-CoA hydratase
MSIELAALTGKGNYFENFNVGDVYEHARGKTIEGLENVLITNLVLNTAQLHFNEQFAESQAQHHRVTFGGVTASIVIGLAMQDTGENAVEEIGLDQVRFRVPVLHGDTLSAFTEVVAKDENPSDARGHKNVGLVHFRHWGINQRGETVFEGERLVLVKKRAFSTAGLEVEDEALAKAMPRQTVKRAGPAPATTPSAAKARVVKRARTGAKVARVSKEPRTKPRTKRRK